MTDARRAFTLVEVMVASAIAGLVLAAAVSVTTSIQLSFLRQREVATLDEHAEFLEEYFAPFLRQVGQRTMRPWESVRTTCAAAPCIDAPIHWIEFRDGVHAQPVGVWNGAPGTLAFAAVDGACPLEPSKGWSAGPQTVVLLPEAQRLEGWQEMRCTPNLASCTCQLTAMPGPVATSTVRAGAWGRPRVAPGSTVTLRRDAAAQELILDRDLDGDGTREAVRLADDVFGFALLFGLRDDVTGAVNFTPVPDPARPAALRMLRLELAVGALVDHPRSNTPLTLGAGVVAPVANTLLRATSTTVALPTAVGL